MHDNFYIFLSRRHLRSSFSIERPCSVFAVFPFLRCRSDNAQDGLNYLLVVKGTLPGHTDGAFRYWGALYKSGGVPYPSTVIQSNSPSALIPRRLGN